MMMSRDGTTQAIGQQHTSPLRARCEARRREVVVICGCGNGLARDAPEASRVDGELRAGGPQGLQAKPGGDTRPRANHRPRVDDGRDPAEVRCMQPLDVVACRSPRGVGCYAKEVVSRVAHATPGLVAQCVESVALRYGMSLCGEITDLININYYYQTQLSV